MHCVPQLEDVISAIRLLQLVELLSTQGGSHREERNRADKKFAPNATPPCNECARRILIGQHGFQSVRKLSPARNPKPHEVLSSGRITVYSEVIPKLGYVRAVHNTPE